MKEEILEELVLQQSEKRPRWDRNKRAKPVRGYYRATEGAGNRSDFGVHGPRCKSWLGCVILDKLPNISESCFLKMSDLESCSLLLAIKITLGLSFK